MRSVWGWRRGRPEGRRSEEGARGSRGSFRGPAWTAPIALLVGLLLAGIAAQPAEARRVQSGFGFSFELGEPWVVLTQQEVAERYGEGSLEEMGLAFLEGLGGEGLLERVRAGRVEMYLLPEATSSKAFDGITVQVRGSGGRPPRNDEEAYEICRALKGGIGELRADAALIECALGRTQGARYMHTGFSLAEAGVTVRQDEFPLSSRLVLMIVSSATDDAIARVRSAHGRVRRAVAAYVDGLPDYAGMVREARSLYEKGRFAEARRVLRPAAEFGDPEAQYLMGVLRHDQDADDRDPAAAADWYRRAAEQGHEAAMTTLASLYFHGEGVEKDLATAAALYRQAALAGVPSAQNSYAGMLFEGMGVERDRHKAVSWFLRAAEQGNAEAAQNLLAVLEPLAEGGDVQAMHTLGVVHLRGLGRQSSDQGISWLERAAENGHEPSRELLAQVFAEGLYGVEKDPERARRYRDAKQTKEGAGD